MCAGYKRARHITYSYDFNVQSESVFGFAPAERNQDDSE